MKNLPGNRKFEKSMAKEWNHVMIADENISYHGGLSRKPSEPCVTLQEWNWSG